jgi:type VI secretion system protein ImpA
VPETHQSAAIIKAYLAALEQELRAALADWQALDAVVDGFMAHDAPGLGRVGQSLALLAHTCALLKGEEPQEDAPAAVAAQLETTMADEILEPAPQEAVELPTRRAFDGPMTRTKAYQQPETIADFLLEYEPHSPVP